jgi:hypothetical protein
VQLFLDTSAGYDAATEMVAQIPSSEIEPATADALVRLVSAVVNRWCVSEGPAGGWALTAHRVEELPLGALVVERMTPGVARFAFLASGITAEGARAWVQIATAESLRWRCVPLEG